MNDQDHDMHELVAMVALDALPAGEHERAVARIERNPQLRAELAELRAVLADLHDDAAVTPPPSLRASVLAAVGDVEQDRADGRDDPQVSAAAPLTVVDGGAQVAPSPMPVAARRRSGLLGLSAAAAVCALVAGLVAWFALGRSDGGDEIADVVDDPAAETVDLQGELAGLRLTYVPGTDEAVLLGDGIGDPGDDRAYQLWFLGDDAPVPSEVFQPDADGEVEVLVDDFDGGDSEYAVTNEPASGSDEPTLPIRATTG